MVYEVFFCYCSKSNLFEFTLPSECPAFWILRATANSWQQWCVPQQVLSKDTYDMVKKNPTWPPSCAIALTTFSVNVTSDLNIEFKVSEIQTSPWFVAACMVFESLRLARSWVIIFTKWVSTPPFTHPGSLPVVWWQYPISISVQRAKNGCTS